MGMSACELVYSVCCQRFPVVLEKAEWVHKWYVICDMSIPDENMKSKNI